MNGCNSFSWEDARIFLSVVEHKSFSAAAMALGMGQPTVSRRIKSLEQEFELQLFIRGKYGAEPTVGALALITAAEQMAKWATEFDRAIKGTDQALSGTVTIAAPPAVAVEQLAPFAALLKTLEPSIQLEILSSIDHVDLTRGIADLAIRTQAPQEPELISLYEAKIRSVVVASKEYAAKVKNPCAPGDLDWITWGGQYKRMAPRPMLEKLIPNFSPVFTSDDYLVLTAAIEEGLGACIISEPMGFSNSDLVELEIGLRIPPTEFYIVCAKSMQQVPRVRVVVERLIQGILNGS